MTAEQKYQIENMRLMGKGYASIAETLGLPKETVKSFCKRSSLGGVRAVTQQTRTKDEMCPQCGQQLLQIAGRKPARFCSPSCRQAWWNSHPNHVMRKAIYSFTCANCGREFSAYGNNHRKYCSHDCYTQARYKGGIRK